MKILKISVVLFVLFLTLGNVTHAQTLKLAHIDSQELMAAMPEQAKAKTELEQMQDKLQAQLKTMQSELQKKYGEYQKMMEAGNASDLIRKNKETDLNDLQARIQQFQQGASTDLQKKQEDLIKPIIDKARKAIEDVAKESGYTYVFDISAGTIIYHAPNTTDILPMVKKKLGIQ